MPKSSPAPEPETPLIPSPPAPLADRLRPQSLNEVVGQSHLLGPGKPLRVAFESKRLHSFILWGPPGVGKTTIGRLAAGAVNGHFACISAAHAGVKEIRKSIDDAQAAQASDGKQTVLFVDEIHRFNKNQQDELLQHVESGLIILIGGTTEHPGMQVNNALLSRAQVYAMQPLTVEELGQLYKRAEPFLSPLTFTAPAVNLLCDYADGDGRRFLNLVEQVWVAARASQIEQADEAFAKTSVTPSLRRFDNGGDVFYEQLSAFHKSVRGSNPDGALYWLARMLDGGADARHITRRMIAIASEDIGNADPTALQLAVNATLAYERLGSPEGELALAQAATYLAVAPKSNAAYVALNQAREFVRRDGSRPVPIHLRNAPAKLMREMGYGQSYRYAHDEPNAYAAGQSYLPDGVGKQNWYRPSQRGVEKKIADRLSMLEDLDRQHHQNSRDDRS